MKVLSKIEGFIFQAPAWKLITVVLGLMFFKTGLWYMPNIGASHLVAQNPFVNPLQDPNAHYIYWTWLAPFLAWCVRARSFWRFTFLHFLFVAAFTALFIKIIFSRLSDRAARTSLVIFALLPVSATAYYWVGMDGLTLLLMLLILSFHRLSVAAFCLGTALGMQHFEQGFFAFAGVLAAFIAAGGGLPIGFSLIWGLMVLIGVVAGKCVLVALFHFFHVTVNAGRTYWLMGHLDSLLKQFIFHVHVVFWSVLGLGWVILVSYAERGKRALPFLVPFLGLLVFLLPISEDQTRVLSIVTFPLVFIFWLLNQEFLDSLDERFVAWLAFLWIIVPWAWVWQGVPRWSIFPFNMVYLLKPLGLISVPADATSWPF